MLTKSHKLGGAHFAVILFLLTAACSTNNSATRATLQKKAVDQKIVDEKTVRTFDCRNPDEYRFDVVQNPNRKRDSDPVVPRDLNVVVGDEAISKIELPKESILTAETSWTRKNPR